MNDLKSVDRKVYRWDLLGYGALRHTIQTCAPGQPNDFCGMPGKLADITAKGDTCDMLHAQNPFTPSTKSIVQYHGGKSRV